MLSADSWRCTDVDKHGRRLDVPDAPVRAVKWGGEFISLAAHYNNLRYYSRDLKTFERRDCKSLIQSRHDGEPSHFGDHEWLVSLYVNGDLIFGLIHNEYWGGLYDDRCRKRLGKRDPWSSICLYVNLTGAISSDGREFQRTGIVAAYPYPFSTDMNRHGVRDPTNIFRNPNDGYVYFLAIVDAYKAQRGGMCLFRSKDPFKGSWFAWDGAGFSVKLESPYRRDELGHAMVCNPVSGLNMTTVLYHEQSNSFIALVFEERIKPGGIFYRTSRDLIHWSSAKFLMEAHDFHHWIKSEGPPIVYPSLIDPKSKSLNFDTTGNTPYLYFIRSRVERGKLLGRDRDIIRRNIKILPNWSS